MDGLALQPLVSLHKRFKSFSFDRFKFNEVMIEPRSKPSFGHWIAEASESRDGVFGDQLSW